MNRLSVILDKFPAAQLLVIGDLMLDRFIWGDVERLSPEAPVPVLRVVSEKSTLGGAANVIHNVRTLGGRVTACGIIGQDDAGMKIIRILKEIGASTAGIFAEPAYQTIQKTRIIASPHHQQIARLDRESRQPIARATLKKMRDFVASAAAKVDAIVISDYGKGAVHPELLDSVGGLVSGRKTLCVIDPKKENYQRYRLPTLITPNKSEASDAAGIAITDEQTLRLAGQRLLRKWRARGVLITRGAEGMSLFRPGMPVKHFPTASRAVFDVTGAGDTVVSVCALALAGGAAYEDAAVLANLAAGFVGDEIGTVAVPIEKLRNVIEEKS